MAIVHKNGKHAVTNYQTIEVFKNVASLVKCNLETGRTHQIRVHMASIGCHLIGDQLYVKPKKITSKDIMVEKREFFNHFPRQALHAQSLGFVHPRTKQKRFFESEFPNDFQKLLKVLQSI